MVSLLYCTGVYTSLAFLVYFTQSFYLSENRLRDVVVLFARPREMTAINSCLSLKVGRNNQISLGAFLCVILISLRSLSWSE